MYNMANGNIKPCRFTKWDTTADGKVLQAGAGDKISGVSQKGTRLPPLADGIITFDDGYAAIAGDPIMIYRPGGQYGFEILLVLGGTVTRGDRLKSDSDGRGVMTTTNLDEVGAIALRSGVLNEAVQVELIFPTQISS